MRRLVGKEPFRGSEPGSRWHDDESSTKSRKARSVPATQVLAAALRANRETRLRGPDVVSGLDGQPISADSMTDHLHRLYRKAKVTPIGWHALRHTFCSRLAMRGASTS